MMRKYKKKAVYSLLGKIICFVLIITTSGVAFGCEKNESLPTENEPLPTENESLPSNSVTVESTTYIASASDTTVYTTNSEELFLPMQEEIIYKDAIKDFLLVEEYSWERIYSPDMIMIHFTSAVVPHPEAPYDITHIRKIFLDYEVSIHYIIERDGTVLCYIPENRVAWHAGKGEFVSDIKYTDAMNQYAIGIELVGIGSKEDMAGYMSGEEYDALDDSLKGFTHEQYSSLKALVEDICLRYGIPIDREHIIGHEEYSMKKRDPGELFRWELIVDSQK